MSETVPEEVFKTLLDTYWLKTDIPKPNMEIANDVEKAFARIDLKNGDALIIKPGGTESIKYRGNVQYFDRTYPLEIDYRTINSRQRVRDSWQMIRKIIFNNIWYFNSVGYQLIRIVGYQELVGTDLNIWRVVIKISLESAGIRKDIL